MFFLRFYRQKGRNAQFRFIQFVSVIIISDWSIVCRSVIILTVKVSVTAVPTARPTAPPVTSKFRIDIFCPCHFLDHNTLLTLSFNAQDPYFRFVPLNCAHSQKLDRWLPIITQVITRILFLFFFRFLRFFRFDMSCLLACPFIRHCVSLITGANGSAFL